MLVVKRETQTTLVIVLPTFLFGWLGLGWLVRQMLAAGLGGWVSWHSDVGRSWLACATGVGERLLEAWEWPDF